MRSRLALLWMLVRDSLWFVPAIFTTIASLAAFALLAAEQRGILHVEASAGLVFGGGAESARSLLSAVAGGLITVTGVAFSITIVALELSSSQYTPRILPNFMSDRANQVVIGILIGTFTYSLLVLRVIDTGSEGEREFIPRVAVTAGMVLALLSVATVIFYINHAATSIQISWILQRATSRALEQVEGLFPEEFGREDRSTSPEEEPPPDHVAINAPQSGYLQNIDQTELFRAGEAAEGIIRVEHRIGGFVLEGEPLARAWPSEAFDERGRSRLTRAFRLGKERTSHQDYELSLIEIADIAVKALSPGINDPTTAQNCIDRLAQLLLALACRHSPTRIRTREGRLHVIVKDLPFERAVATAFSQILHFGSTNPVIVRRLLERIDALVGLVPAARRQPLLEMRRMVVEKSEGLRSEGECV